MHAFLLGIGNKFDPKSQVFRLAQLQSDRFTVQFSPNQAGQRLKRNLLRCSGNFGSEARKTARTVSAHFRFPAVAVVVAHLEIGAV